MLHSNAGCNRHAEELLLGRWKLATPHEMADLDLSWEASMATIGAMMETVLGMKATSAAVFEVSTTWLSC